MSFTWEMRRGNGPVKVNKLSHLVVVEKEDDFILFYFICKPEKELWKVLSTKGDESFEQHL